MLHACEGPTSVVHHSAPQTGLSGVEDAQGVVEGQAGYEALLGEVPYVRDRPVVDATAGKANCTTGLPHHL